MEQTDALSPSSIASSRSRTSLCTLPDELLGEIFGKLPSNYILPPINRQLLPFHHSQLFRNVVLTFRNFDQFWYLIDLNEHLQQYPDTLTLDFSPRSNPIRENLSPPRRRYVNSLLASLTNLKQLAVKVACEFDNRYYPTSKDLDRNPSLRTISIQSSLPAVNEVVEGLQVFEFEALRYVEEDDVIGVTDEGVIMSPTLRDTLLEVKRLDDVGNYCVRYSSNSPYEASFVTWARSSTPITRFETVSLSTETSLPSRLALLSQPALLTHLSLFAIDAEPVDTSLPTVYLDNFPNITHLSIGGTAYLDTIAFYDTLRQLPLEFFCIGPRANVTAQRVIDLLSKPRLSTLLRILVMEIIDSDGPEDFSLNRDFRASEWTRKCPYQKMQELRRLTKKLGVETKGSTFDGLALREVIGFDGALIRMDRRRLEEQDRQFKERLEGRYTDEYQDRDSDRDSCGTDRVRELDESNHDIYCECGRGFLGCLKAALIGSDDEEWEGY